MGSSPQYWAVVPAAGVGRRMQSKQPKQYLELQGKTVLDWTLTRLFETQLFSRVVVCISAEDEYWQDGDYAQHADVLRAPGGAERADSVLQGLSALKALAHPDDWVLVHDAARPCVMPSDIKQLVAEVEAGFDGGVLGVPATDTLKWVSEGDKVDKTLDRRHVWRAFTPQMFRFQALYNALQRAAKEQWLVTDESSAMEQVGVQPLMVAGRSDNIKITLVEDLAIASNILKEQS